MEYPHDNTTESRTPSKAFFIRASIAIIFVALILFFQSDFFSKKIQEKQDKKTQQALIEKNKNLIKDSNGNSIADWEEQLWGLDPAVIATNGIPNKDIIEKKKKNLIEQNGTTISNKTEKFAQSVYIANTLITAQNNGGDASALSSLSDQMYPDQYKNTFSNKNIKTVPTNSKTLAAYQKKMSDITSSEEVASLDEIDILSRAADGEEVPDIATLKKTGDQYQSLAKKLIAIQVPVGLARIHLAFVNDIYNIGTSLIKSSIVSDDPIAALPSIGAYRNYSLSMQENATAIQNYLMRYTILTQ